MFSIWGEMYLVLISKCSPPRIFGVFVIIADLITSYVLLVLGNSDVANNPTPQNAVTTTNFPKEKRIGVFVIGSLHLLELAVIASSMTPSWTTNGRREEETQGNGKDAKLKKKDVDDYDDNDDDKKDNHGEFNRNQQFGQGTRRKRSRGNLSFVTGKN